MKKIILLLSFCSIFLVANEQLDKNFSTPRVTAHVVDLNKDDLRLFLKDNDGTFFNNFEKLNSYLEKSGKKLSFAMNGGMYMQNSMPLGLYMEDGKVVKKINLRKKAFGNFYMQPNGVFYITKDRKVYVVKTTDFKQNQNIKYATQSGPMLIINGKMHPKFIKGSKNLNIRNGVGILKDGRALFAISKEPINFYDFANYFKNKGCKNALYFDGFVSDIYLPPKSIKFFQNRFGVIVGQVADK